MAELTYKDALKCTGQVFWVCAFRKDDISKKAQRYQEPQQAIVQSNGVVVLGDNNMFLYNNKGFVTKKKVVEANTYIFDDVDECAAKFVELAGAVRDHALRYAKKISDDATAINASITKYSK